MYISCIIDLFSRKIISWELSRELGTATVIDAIRKALLNSNGIRPKIIHTDRGVQYTSDAYAAVAQGIQESYSSKGNS